jgi:hypothetical protein
MTDRFVSAAAGPRGRSVASWDSADVRARPESPPALPGKKPGGTCSATEACLIRYTPELHVNCA